MEAPGGEHGYAHTAWMAPHFTPELAAHKLAEQLAADVLLLGRRTYESFAGARPQREGPMADRINTMTKVVASTTLSSEPLPQRRAGPGLPGRQLTRPPGSPAATAPSA